MCSVFRVLGWSTGHKCHFRYPEMKSAGVSGPKKLRTPKGVVGQDSTENGSCVVLPCYILYERDATVASNNKKELAPLRNPVLARGRHHTWSFIPCRL